MNDNYTPLHNEILEALAKINLAPYETRVLFVIWRKTYGFIDPKTNQRKKQDWIAGSQISKMTGLDRRLVYRALQGLKKKNVISRDDKKTGFSKEFMKLMSSVEMTKEKTNNKMSSILPHMSSILPPPPVKNDDKMSSILPHTKEKKESITKETIQKKYSSIKDLDQITFNDIANKYKVPVSFVISKLDDMTNWLEAKGKKYKNYKAALSNWVKTDALKIITKQRQNVNSYKPTTIKI